MIKKTLAGGALVLAALTFTAAPSFAIQPVDNAAKVKVYSNVGEIDKKYLTDLIDQVKDQTGVKLHLYLVDTLDGLSGSEWASQTFKKSKFAKENSKDKNVVFVIATEDKLYGSSYSGSKAIANRIKSIENNAVEFMGSGEWEAAMTAFINSVNEVETNALENPNTTGGNVDSGYEDSDMVYIPDPVKTPMTQAEKDAIRNNVLMAGGGVLAASGIGIGGFFYRRKIISDKDYANRISQAKAKLVTLESSETALVEKKDFLSIHFDQLPVEIDTLVNSCSADLTATFAILNKESEQTRDTRFEHLQELEKNVASLEQKISRVESLIIKIEDTIKDYDNESLLLNSSIAQQETIFASLKANELQFAKDFLEGSSTIKFVSNEKTLDDIITNIRKVKEFNDGSSSKSDKAYSIVNYKETISKDFVNAEKNIRDLFQKVKEMIDYVQDSPNSVKEQEIKENHRIFRIDNHSLENAFSSWKQQADDGINAINFGHYDIYKINDELISAKQLYMRELNAQIEYERKLREAQENFSRISNDIERRRNRISSDLHRSGVGYGRRSSFNNYNSEYERARSLASTDIIAAYAMLSSINSNFSSLQSSISMDISSYTNSLNNNNSSSFGSSGGGFGGSSGSSGGGFGGGNSSSGSSGGSF